MNVTLGLVAHMDNGQADGNYYLEFRDLGSKDITSPLIENHMDQNMENEMEKWSIWAVIEVV